MQKKLLAGLPHRGQELGDKEGQLLLTAHSSYVLYFLAHISFFFPLKERLSSLSRSTARVSMELDSEPLSSGSESAPTR